MEACLRQSVRDEIELLDPRFQSTSLIGRDDDLSFLFDWLNSEPPIAITALVGAGGSGKTRLALELLTKLPSTWQGGFLLETEAKRFLARENAGEWSWQSSTLIVVDYAAVLTNTLAQWFAELVDHPASQHKLRILLIERHGHQTSGWYRDLSDASWRGRGVRRLFFPIAPIGIAPIDTLHNRRKLLEESIGAVSLLGGYKRSSLDLPAPGAEPWFDQKLAADQWSDPLLLLMAGIIAASDGLSAALSLSRPNLAKALAERERDRIRRSVDTSVAKDLLAHLYACVTLCGGLTHDQALLVAETEFANLQKQYPGGTGQAVGDLSRLLSTGTALPALVPDLLGEALLYMTLGDLGPGSVTRLCRIAPHGVAASLVRCAQDFASAEETWPLAWLRALIAQGKWDTSILIEIEAALPKNSLVLSEAAVEITKELIASLTAFFDWAGSISELTSVTEAHLWTRLAVRQGDIGMRSESLTSSCRATQLFRALAQNKADAFQTELSMCLTNQARSQADMGMHNEALESIADAVGILRRSSEANPLEHLGALSNCLGNQSLRLGEAGQNQEALDSISESVRLRRLMVIEDPGAYLPDLAMSLNTQASHQSELGQLDEALVSIQEGLRIHQMLVEGQRDANIVEFARSLNTYGSMLASHARFEDALPVITEAVDIRRSLAKRNPHAFMLDLATSASNQSAIQNCLGKHSEALSSISEAIQAYRSLLVDETLDVREKLGTALRKQAKQYVDLSQHAEALCCIVGAIEILRSLCNIGQDALSSLTGALEDRAAIEESLRRYSESLDSRSEAILIYRECAASDSEYRVQLADTLFRHMEVQYRAGLRIEALASVTEVVALRRESVSQYPEDSDVLAISLNSQAIQEAELGQPLEALVHVSEAIEIKRVNKKVHLERSSADLAGMLNNKASILVILAQPAAGRVFAIEAVNQYRTLVNQGHKDLVPYLAGALSALGDCCEAIGLNSEALGSASESLCLLAPILAGGGSQWDELAQGTLKDYQRRCRTLRVSEDTMIQRIYVRSADTGDLND